MVPPSPSIPAPTIQSVSYASPAPSPSPPSLRQIDHLPRTPLTLEAAVRMGLENSPVIRNAGGRVLVAPESVRTRFDPQIVDSDPNGGQIAAQSAFDTRLQSSLTGNGGGQGLGGSGAGGTFGTFTQPQSLASAGWTKTYRSGTRVTYGGLGGHDPDLASGAFAAVGASVRQPLMRGAGREVNEIAGPYAQTGSYRGVRIARLNSERSHIEMERAVRDYVAEVVNTYWELHFAYQDLETKRRARELAQRSWDLEQRRVEANVSPADFEALARQQFYAADAAFQNAAVGSSGKGGVYSVELKLRSLLGLPAVDHSLVQPSTQPLETELQFDWEESLALAQNRRVELRKQRVNVSQRELEVIAARNMERWDVALVGQYRRPLAELSNQSTLFGDAFTGWQAGVQVDRALGNRREQSGTRNAELHLSREQAILIEQEKQLAAQLREAFNERERAFAVTRSLGKSRDAARIHLDAEIKRHAAGDADLDRVLEAQRRTAETETAYSRSLVDYNLSIVGVHLVRSTLLDMLGVGFVNEAPLPQQDVTPIPDSASHARRASY